MIPVEPFEVRVLHPPFEQAICLVRTTRLDRPPAFALPTHVAAAVVERIEDREHDLASLRQRLDAFRHRIGHEMPKLDSEADRRNSKSDRIVPWRWVGAATVQTTKDSRQLLTQVLVVIWFELSGREDTS